MGRTFIVSDKCPTLTDFWTRGTTRDQTGAKNGDDYRLLSSKIQNGKKDVQANPISTLGSDLPRDLLPVNQSPTSRKMPARNNRKLR